jgi:hypothetical protein
VDIEHFQRFFFRAEPMGRSRRKAEEVAGFQGVRLAVEDGGPPAGQNEVKLLGELVIADAGSLVRLDADAVGGDGGLLGLLSRVSMR